MRANVPPDQAGRAPERSGESAGENEPQIRDVNEGVVEGGEDAGNAENELACSMRALVRLMIAMSRKVLSDIPSPARGPRETFSLAGVFLGGAIATVVMELSWMEYGKEEKPTAVGDQRSKKSGCVP